MIIRYVLWAINDYDGVIFRISSDLFSGFEMAKMSNDAQIGISLDPRDSGFCDTLAITIIRLIKFLLIDFVMLN